jgi:hypothetical protein
MKSKKKSEPALPTATGEEPGTSSDEDVGGGPAGGGPSNGGGNGGGGGPSLDNPPNRSGDSAGYNTTLFPSPLPVRVGLKSFGYDVDVLSTNPVGGKDDPNIHAQAFQAHYNQAASSGFHGAVGELKMDGWMGANSLNALEIILQYRKDGGEDNWGAINPQ